MGRRGFDAGFVLVSAFILCQWTLTTSLSANLNKACWVAKTKETFKLSDLQYLEAKLQERNGYECERLVVDASTGSSLFRLNGTCLHESMLENELPSSLRRCEWVASILAHGKTAEELLMNIRDDGKFMEHSWEKNAAWTLEYLRLNHIGAPRVQPASYTSKSLSCSVAQAVRIPAALNPDEATDRFRIIDTGEDLFLVRLMREADPSHPLTKKWSQRPFPFSSAINPNVADILIDLVFDLVQQKDGVAVDPISFLDPTCGSGTFLAFAASRGASVKGWDTNESCIDGALRNIKFVFGNDCAKFCEVHLRDASNKKLDDGKQYDCMIANLPWGQNTMLYYNENIHILDSLQSSLRPGAPCAIISKDLELQKDMERLGYHILGTAHIPPLHFVLPTGKNKNAQKRNEETFHKERKSHCVVTVALAPQ